MGRYTLPLGFRFHPTDVELVKYYLKRKVLGKKLPFQAISEIDIYKYAPWDLPELSCLKTGDLKWFFFCPVEKKYARGGRLNRSTVFGYWKTTGKDRAVKYNEETVGMIKTLVFHQGKAPSGTRTDWVMHEYRLEDKELSDRGVVQDSYVLCIVFKKDGLGPKHGAHYGAPFKEEEDWSESENESDESSSNLVKTGFLSGISGVSTSYAPQTPCPEPSVDSNELNPNSTVDVNVATDTNGVDAPDHPLVVLESDAVPELMEAPQLVQVQDNRDDMLTLLDIFTEDDINDSVLITGNSSSSFLQSPPLLSDDDEVMAMLASYTDEQLNHTLFNCWLPLL